MKANELMIGDWVRFPIGIEKIVDLPYVEGKGICASFAANATLFPVELNKLEQIPLTPEILEKNGFVKQGFPGWEIYTGDFLILWRNDYPDILEIRSFNAAYGSFYRSHISYVHELQHAMRLVGIKEKIVL